jgi:hypothetical protein
MGLIIKIKGKFWNSYGFGKSFISASGTLAFDPNLGRVKISTIQKTKLVEESFEFDAVYDHL